MDATLAIVFADIAGSTRLYETLGDARARDAIAGGLAVLARVTQRMGGRVVKTIGDELMATFDTATQAVAAAIGMQDAILELPPTGGRRMAIRVGLHFGPVLTVDDDVFGDAVNVAARMAAQAKAGEILTTGPTVALLDARARRDCRQIGWVEVKGKAEPIEICEVMWRAEEATTMRIAPSATAPTMRSAGIRLLLSAGDRSVEVSATSPSATLGRSDEVSLTVAYARVSRQHARVEMRNDRFMLADQSANGTFVVLNGAAPRLVHRDNCELTGHGLLGLGEEPAEGSPARVVFEILR